MSDRPDLLSVGGAPTGDADVGQEAARTRDEPDSVRLDDLTRRFDEALALTAASLPAQVLTIGSAALEEVEKILASPGLRAADETRGLVLRARLLLTTSGASYDLDADRAASLDRLDRAADSARRAGADDVVMAVHGQRAYIAMRAGDAETATAEYDRAVALIAAAEPRDACVLLLNRGCLSLEQGRLAQARHDFEDCVDRARSAGLPGLVHRASHNLAYGEFLGGDLPRAFAMFDAAEELLTYEGASEDQPVVALDRAQVFVEAGLLSEADAQLRSARASFEERGFGHERGEVDLLRARVALLLDDPGQGLALARAARLTFAKRQNAVWKVRADLVVHQALVALHEAREPVRTRSLLAVAARVEILAAEAGALARSAGAEVARDARVLAAQAYVRGGALRRAQSLLEGIDSSYSTDGDGPLALPGRGSLPRQLHRVLVGAHLAFAQGDRSGGRSQVAAGQALLGGYRAQFGSVDAVTASSIHGLRLIEADLADALASGSADLVLETVERGRAAFAGPAGVRPDVDPAVAEATSRLRQLSEQLRLLPADADPHESARLSAEASGVRQEVRAMGWRRGSGHEAPTAMTMDQVQAQVAARGDLTVINFMALHGVLHAVVVDRLGARLEVVGPAAAIDEQVRRVRGDLAAMANTLIPEGLRATAVRSLRSGAARLDEVLLAGVRERGPLHVVAPGFLLALPWQELPSRRGLATSAGSHLLDLPPEPGPRRRAAVGGVTAVAGPQVRLAGREAEAVAGLWPGAEVLDGAAATTTALVRALGARDVVHLAAHGTHVVANPLFSSVRLSDGPLFAYELEGMRLHPTVVVLSACEVGQVTPTPGGQVLGFASVLLRLGVQTVVAAVGPVDDAVAHAAMSRFHERLRGGATPQDSLADAAAASDVPLPFVCFASTLHIGPAGVSTGDALASR
ncbi:CHAT domain-containing protein [Sanguibacter gelidistatuariae]|uniref:CHAT domain-containing protein n=1 Tax=Sanguibacter gelidistatuariae TaxID=1814289 RepID=A0A1G6K977_9MICO|nr:CHAT domain-containing protein [Sanguibacter gelidistatuariae]SDC27570.1 CHAT domain-containing protein [Sanguibacter gelidistatuariae]